MSLTEHRLSIMSNIVRDKDLEDLKKYEVYGTSDFGAVAIDYSKTKELVNILDEMNDLVEGRILPEMEDIADSLFKEIEFLESEC
jgi:hypothetical protein